MRDLISRSSCLPGTTWFSTDKSENHEVKIKGTHQKLHMLLWHMSLRRRMKLTPHLQQICETTAYHTESVVFYGTKYLEITIHYMPHGWSHEVEMKKVWTTSQSARPRSSLGTLQISLFGLLRSKYTASKWKADDQKGQFIMKFVTLNKNLSFARGILKLLWATTQFDISDTRVFHISIE